MDLRGYRLATLLLFEHGFYGLNDAGDWEMSRTNILLADDHVLALEALVYLLRQDFNVIGAARDGYSLVQLARQKAAEVIVMTITMPSLTGIDAIRILQKESCSSKILFLTRHIDIALLEEALRAGASGFVLKMCESAELAKAIQLVARGITYVSPMFAGTCTSSRIRDRANSWDERNCSNRLDDPALVGRPLKDSK